MRPLIDAIDEFKPRSVIIAGGVAANKELRAQAAELSIKPIFPDFKLCTDNAAMIASCAFYTQKQVVSDPYSLAPEPSLSM